MTALETRTDRTKRPAHVITICASGDEAGRLRNESIPHDTNLRYNIKQSECANFASVEDQCPRMGRPLRR
jgi:hypothetical protein